MKAQNESKVICEEKELGDALSPDLTIITAEINNYKQIAGQSIFEIGRRLKVCWKKNCINKSSLPKEKIENNPADAAIFMLILLVMALSLLAPLILPSAKRYYSVNRSPLMLIDSMLCVLKTLLLLELDP